MSRPRTAEVEEHREVEKAAVVAREEVAAAVVAKVVAAAAAAKVAVAAKDKATPVDGQARQVAVAAKDKATPVDGQARQATLRVEAGRTQGNPSELDLAPFGLQPKRWRRAGK